MLENRNGSPVIARRPQADEAISLLPLRLLRPFGARNDSKFLSRTRKLVCLSTEIRAAPRHSA
jgi:hypothetical protein